MTCIEVTCTPGEVVACRADGAVTCNGTGSDYDVVACASGCDVGLGCRACSVNEDCGDETPICDAGLHSCRPCEFDDECVSRICNRGRCLGESQIAYASPSGSGVSSCSLEAPCTPMRAIAVAMTATPQLSVRLLPGLYEGGVEVRTPMQLPLEIVGTGAMLDGVEGGLRVSGGSNLVVRGISASGANRAVTCGEAQGPSTTLVLENSVASDVVNSSNCNLTMSAVECGVLAISSDTIFEGDRLHIRAETTAGAHLLGSRIQFRLTNSVLEDALVLFSTFDTQPPGTRASFGFNTFVLRNEGSAIACVSNSGSAHRVVRFENNIVFAPALTAAVDGNDCFLSNNVLMPQPNNPLGNLVVDPQLVDAENGDFRLRATSPAIDAGRMGPTIFTDHDFLGIGRPQGGAADIGAYEQ